jgi:hypothetical protein
MTSLELANAEEEDLGILKSLDIDGSHTLGRMAVIAGSGQTKDKDSYIFRDVYGKPSLFLEIDRSGDVKIEAVEEHPFRQEQIVGAVAVALEHSHIPEGHIDLKAVEVPEELFSNRMFIHDKDQPSLLHVHAGSVHESTSAAW